MLLVTCLFLGAPTISYNNIFGNNNEIYINGNGVGEITSPPSPALSPTLSPPPPFSTPSCDLSTETINVDAFPPNDMPIWANPFQEGTAGYPETAIAKELLNPAVLEQSLKLMPYGITCLGFRGLLKAFSKDSLLGDPTAPDNTLYELPQPGLIPEGKTYMDEYLVWKSQTPLITDSHIRLVREAGAIVIETFMLILVFEQWATYSDFGTKYAADLIFWKVPEIKPVDAASMGGGGDWDLISPDLFPLYPKYKQAMEVLVEEFKVNRRGMSGWFTDDKSQNYISGVNYVGSYSNLESHIQSAISVGKNTGLSERAIEEYKIQMSASYSDTKANTIGTEFQVAPDYKLNPPGSGPNIEGYPIGFEICADARKLYDHMATIITPTNDKPYTCSQGATIIKALSDLFLAEIDALKSPDPESCSITEKMVEDIAFSVLSTISLSQQKAYGIYGNPILTPEQTRVMLVWSLRILYKHIGPSSFGGLNSYDSCIASGKKFVGRPAGMIDYYRMISMHSEEDETADDTIAFISSDLNRQARATAAEMKAIHDDFVRVCGSAIESFRCPYEPPKRLSGPVCDNTRNGVIGGTERIVASMDNALLRLIKLGQTKTIGTILWILNECSLFLTIAEKFDDTYLEGSGSPYGGCGFESWIHPYLQKISNVDSELGDFCSTSCNRSAACVLTPEEQAIKDAESLAFQLGVAESAKIALSKGIQPTDLMIGVFMNFTFKEKDHMDTDDFTANELWNMVNTEFCLSVKGNAAAEILFGPLVTGIQTFSAIDPSLVPVAGNMSLGLSQLEGKSDYLVDFAPVSCPREHTIDFETYEWKPLVWNEW